VLLTDTEPVSDWYSNYRPNSLLFEQFELLYRTERPTALIGASSRGNQSE